MKNILKHITLFVVLLSLAGSFVSCKKEKEKLKEGEYKAECAIISVPGGFNLGCWTVLIESEKPIGNTEPSGNHVSFYVDNLPREFRHIGMRATIVFRITNETKTCWPSTFQVIEIVLIKECE